ncbi:MAG: fused MFS/spermidine synthase [Sumerlaeia bacterium]
MSDLATKPSTQESQPDRPHRTAPAEDPLGGTRRFAIALMFLLSGAAGLVYQVVWTRQLTTMFGATLYAVATVLTAFMGGLALGSWLFGKKADSLKRPLLFYGGLEVGIAVAGLLFPLALRLTEPILGAFYATGGEGTFFVFSLLRFALAGALLLVPTTLMGATLPVMSKAITADFERVGRRVGGLYALNTTGAVVGTFLTGFYLIEALGISGTTFVAVTVNVIVAALAAAIGWSLLTPEATHEPYTNAIAAPPVLRDTARISAKGALRLVLATYFLCGLIALCYQIAWTRSLIFGFETLKATTYSFAGMLTVFLLGLAIGSAAMQAIVDRLRDPLAVYITLIFGIALTGALSSFVIKTDLPPWLVMEELDGDRLRWWAAIGNIFFRTTLAIGLPTLLMGMAFPVVARLSVGRLAQLGHDIGVVYALNTLGAILGSFLGGFVLIPLLGISTTIAILAVAGALAACALLAIHPAATAKGQPLRVGVLGAMALAAVLIVAIRSAATQFHQTTAGEKTIYYEEGPLATVSVFEDNRGWRTIYVDAVGVAGTEPYLQTDQKSLAHVPAVLLGGEATRVLTVGFGAGGASWSYTLYPDIEEIHAIEISPEVLEAAPTMTGANHGILYPEEQVEEAIAEGLDRLPGAAHPLADYTVEPVPGFRTFDPRYRVIVDDARSYLRFTDLSYDVIATDCTDLRYKSNANLYDLQYFELCRERLTERGLCVVWMPLGGLSDEAFRIVLRTFKEVFPQMSVWYFTNQPIHYCLFIGGRGQLEIDPAAIERALVNQAIQGDLDEIGLREPAKLIASFVADERGLDAYVGEGPLNTENTPIIEFLSPRYGYGPKPVAENMGNIYAVQVPAWDLVSEEAQGDRSLERKVARYQKANLALFEGHSLYRFHDFPGAARAYVEARKIAPEDDSIDRLLEFDDLRRLTREELENPREMGSPLWINAQWIANSLARAYLVQGRYEDVVSTALPFLRRVPPPSALPPDNVLYREMGVALATTIAEAYEGVNNRGRGWEYRAMAQEYEVKTGGDSTPPSLPLP